MSTSCTSYIVLRHHTLFILPTMLPYLQFRFVVGNWKFWQTAHPGAAVEGAAGLQKVRAWFAFALISWASENDPKLHTPKRARGEFPGPKRKLIWTNPSVSGVNCGRVAGSTLWKVVLTQAGKWYPIKFIWVFCINTNISNNSFQPLKKLGFMEDMTWLQPENMLVLSGMLVDDAEETVAWNQSVQGQWNHVIMWLLKWFDAARSSPIVSAQTYCTIVLATDSQCFQRKVMKNSYTSEN